MTDDESETTGTTKRAPLLSTIGGRLALAVALVGFVVALSLSLVPTSAGPTNCGWWFHPRFTTQNVAQADKLEELGDQLESLGDQSSADRAHGTADAARLGYVWCSGKLDDRRTWSSVAFAAAIVLPAAVLFVTGRRRR